MREYVNRPVSRCYEILDPSIIEWDRERKRRKYEEEHPQEQPRIDIDDPHDDKYYRRPPEEEKEESGRGVVHIQLKYI